MSRGHTQNRPPVALRRTTGADSRRPPSALPAHDPAGAGVAAAVNPLSPGAGFVTGRANGSVGGPGAAERPAAGRPWWPWGRLARGRRRRDLEAAVPEALDVLRATVAAGASPATGLAATAESVTGPLADVLQGAVRACALGVPAGRALADAGAAVSVMELVTTGEALDLAATTGAPPGPVLAGVARAATDRVRARQARLAATAGARLSVKVLAALGPGFVGLLATTAPNDVAFLIREPGGWMTLALALAFEAAGLLWARRILEDRR